MYQAIVSQDPSLLAVARPEGYTLCSMSESYSMSVYLAATDGSVEADTRHDHCAALWRSSDDAVELVRYWELERLSGLKHHDSPLTDRQLAHDLLDDLLSREGLRLGEMSAIWGTPGLQTSARFAQVAAASNLSVHSMAHLFSAVLVDWDLFRTSTIIGMALDGAPDWTLDRWGTVSAYAGCVSVLGSLEFFPLESPGPLWYMAHRHFGQEEGTLMALESATPCRVPYDVSSMLNTVDYKRPERVREPARAFLADAESVVRHQLADSTKRTEFGYDSRFSFDENVVSAVMKLVDEVSQGIVDRSLRTCASRLGRSLAGTHLALAGGYALNCPNNSRLLRKHGFSSLTAPPCVNDSGQALGIGLMAMHAAGETASKRFKLDHAFYGTDDLRLEQGLEKYGDFVETVDAFDPDRATADLQKGIVAWVSGAAEIGPRALGHRSLLGDPRNAAVKEQLNQVKGRQWWRPVAPIVLLPFVQDWFEEALPSPFMLQTTPVLANRALQVPAVLHLDGTARIQTLERSAAPLLYELIDSFGRSTGVPMLCNTSLNDRGEPIVNDAVQALNFCVRKGIRVLYVDGTRLGLSRRSRRVGVALPEGPERRGVGAFEGATRREDAF